MHRFKTGSDLRVLTHRLRNSRIELIETPFGPNTGFTVGTNRRGIWWKFVIGATTSRGMPVLEAWRMHATDKGSAADWNWRVPFDGKVNIDTVASLAANIRRWQADADKGIEPNWDHVYAGREARNQWKRSH